MSTLYRKYRPNSFGEIVGQSHIIRTLTNAIKNNRLGQAYLLTGPRGTGKTTIARVFAKTINCLDQQAPKEKSDTVKIEPCNKCANCKLILEDRAMDLVEIDAASHTGVDNIRQLRDTIPLAPSALKYKVYIIDEVHMLSTGAFNALLKTLEEPPAHAVFILATTELHKVPETIISRCQRFDIARLTQEQIINRLRQIAKSEKVEVDDEALEAIATEAEGGMRDAESLLGQIISLEDEKISSKEVSEILGTSSKKLVIEFTKNLAELDQVSCLDLIESMQNDGVNLKNFNKMLLTFLRSLLIIKTNPDHANNTALSLSKEHTQTAKDIASKTSIAQIVQLIELFQRSLQQFKDTTIPQLPLELATIEYALQSAPSTTAGKQDPPKQVNPQNKSASTQDKRSEMPNHQGNQTNGDQKKTSASVETPQQETSKQDQNNIVQSSDPKRANSKVNLEDVLDKWSEILEQIKPHNHSIHAFLKNCTPCGTTNGTIYIKTKYDFYKDKLSEVGNLLTVKKVIATILDTAANVKFVTQKECENMDFGKNGSGKSKKRNILHDAMQVFGGRIVK